MKRRQGDPLIPPLVLSSTYAVAGDPSGILFTYGRQGNPTWSALEDAYAETGGAPCVAFASGMAASAAVIDSLLPRGSRILAPSDAYYGVRRLLELRGVDAKLIASTEPQAFAQAAAASFAALVWIETPSNPGLDIVDIAATAEACHKAGALLVVDNTLATAAGQDPLSLGADVVVVSATKATSGHSDAIIGLASARDPSTIEKLQTARTLGGAIPGSLETWLCLRGLKTLPLRLERASASALALADALSATKVPLSVRYPGLPTHPQHALAVRQMKHFGPVLTFDLATQARAEQFCASLSRIAEATSFGGVETTLERRARWGGDDVSPGLIRMSVGLEPPEAILEELRIALGSLDGP
jgi:cystathionine gamma-lyase